MTSELASPTVTLFFITFNQRDIAAQTLLDVVAQDYAAACLHIVVLDDGSSDGSFDALTEVAAAVGGRCEIIRGQHGAHYRSAALWNSCIAAAPSHTEIFVQVDDVRLRSDFVRRHVDWHRIGPDFIVTGAKFEGPEETWDLSTCRRHSLASLGGHAAYDVPPTAIWGASLSYRRRLLERACDQPCERPYDELMTGYGHIEVELALRLVKAGGRTVYDPSVGVFHRDHDTANEFQRGLDRDSLKRAGLERNAAYICSKHGLTELPRW